MRFCFPVLMLVLAAIGVARAEVPVLYHQPALQSPVRAAPDDLLLIPGYGFAPGNTVAYAAIDDTAHLPAAPPPASTGHPERAGLADVVSTRNVPHSLTVRLPATVRAGATYALWVGSEADGWSSPILINDARPLWFSPTAVSASEATAGLARELKVVGRNLDAAPGALTRVRLSGPTSVTLEAVPGATPDAAALDPYLARVALPARLAPGQYTVSVSRDGRNWIEVRGQRLAVRADPPPPRRFAVSDPAFGGCRAGDGRDASDCVLAAIAAARAAGGGEVYFPAGVWELENSRTRAGLIDYEGILVPPGVDLRGAGREQSIIRRTVRWTDARQSPAFTLLGRNRVSALRFQDSRVYETKDVSTAFLILGADYMHVGDSADFTASADDIVITDNVFDRTYAGVGSGGLAARRLYITHNLFGAFFSGLQLTGNRFNTRYPFGIEDSVIAYNLFKPGSLLDRTNKTASIATEIGASLRTDFSHNEADGTSTEFQYPGDEARGWLAAFFWSINGPEEELLVAENKASCTGDKIGDGAGISFDNNGNTFALMEVADTTAASADSITAAVSLVPRQNGREVPLDTYYRGHWVQLTNGPGVGQVRRVTDYRREPATGRVILRVAPDWDVVPVPGQTRFAVGREYWQVYAIGNDLEHRAPPCQKSNRSRPAGGGIGMWAQTADSVIAANRQHDTDGILTQQNLDMPEHPCADCTMKSFFQYFLEIRDNLVDGEYDWTQDCSASGIALGTAAAPWHDALPPTVGYGVSVAHNTVRRADAQQGGGIAIMSSWFGGPSPNRWPLSNNALIHHNALSDLDGGPARQKCIARHARSGISLPDLPIAWRTVLYRNRCTRVDRPQIGAGVETVRVCDRADTDSCECQAARPPTP